MLGIAALHSMWNTAVQLQISLLMHLLQRGIHFGFRHNLMLPELACSKSPASAAQYEFHLFFL